MHEGYGQYGRSDPSQTRPFTEDGHCLGNEKQMDGLALFGIRVFSL